MWQDVVVDNWHQTHAVFGPQVLRQSLFSRFKVVVVGTVNTFILLVLKESFFHGNFNHANNVVALPGNQRHVSKRLVFKLNDEATFVVAGRQLVDSLDH